METEFVIDARRSLPLRRRILSDAGTVLLWSIWVLLSFPGLIGVADAHPLSAHRVDAFARILRPMEAVGIGVASLILVAAALSAWKLISRQKRPATDVDADILEPHLRRGREAQVCVVHHSDDGRIVAIETSDPLPPATTGSGQDDPPELQRAA